MVNNSAIVNIIESITKKNGAPCKKTLQKMVYLIEKKGVSIGCDYGIHFYGPYSSDLDFAVREMCDEGVLMIEYSSMEHYIKIVDKSLIEPYENGIIDEVINQFGRETPAELELLATALYIYYQVADAQRIKPGVLKIKGSKYSEKRIDSAIARLKETGFIAV